MSGGEERWIISYADMVTLLFALFTALYALGIQDKNKATMLSASIQEALDRPLSQKVIYQPPSVVVPTNDSRAPASQSFLNSKEKCVGGPGAGGMRDPKAAKEMRTMRDDLEKLQDDPELAGKLEVEQLSEREVLVRLTSAGFFNPGGSEPNEEAFRTLEALARRVRSYKAVETRVEGHTDNIPISGGRYPSNWELSAARASAVVRALVERADMDPVRMSAVGYGQYRPIADNNTLEGRKANRRIDILIRQPPNAQEKQWYKAGSSSKKPVSLDDDEAWDEQLILNRRKQAGPAGQPGSADSGEFLESFGLHSGMDETGKPPRSPSPATRRSPSVSTNSSLTLQEVDTKRKGKKKSKGSGH
jgi:chemotaxis protein MotB